MWYVLVDPATNVIFSTKLFKPEDIIEENNKISLSGDRFRWVELWYELVNYDAGELEGRVLDTQRISECEAKERNFALHNQGKDKQAWIIHTKEVGTA